jgi:hypothetical protein
MRSAVEPRRPHPAPTLHLLSDLWWVETKEENEKETTNKQKK